MLLNTHTDANQGKIKRYLYLQDIIGFCESFIKVTEKLGFHIMFKTADSQDILYTSMADDINVTNINLNLIIPILIPFVETQLVFNEATQNIYEISYDQ